MVKKRAIFFRNSRLAIGGLACCLLVQQAGANITLPKIIGHNMVLQRGQAVPIWGEAAPGERVTVRFHNQQQKTVTDKNGHWKVMLDAMQASAEPRQLLIGGNDTIRLTGVLVGEVWLCSGQSNMEYTMRKNSKVKPPPSITNWPVQELETAHNPQIRIFLAERKKMNPDPHHLGWAVAEDSALRSFSAAGYFFAKQLYSSLQVPVGIISAAIPGSRIEPWMPEEALTAHPAFRDAPDTLHRIEGEPGKFYTPMIAPLMPFALKGFLWYQGETNCFLNETVQYTHKMEALIRWWRKAWHNPDLPFYYVQIAPFAYSNTKGLTTETLPRFREAQAAVMQLPHTGMVVTTDLNDSLNELHPHFKWEIGRRLACWALNRTYGKREIAGSGPVFRSVRIRRNEALIDFRETSGGLVSKNSDTLTGFTIAGKDGLFVPAQAIIRGKQVVVTAGQVPEPIAVRLGWHEGDHPNLYNGAGLPAVPFRTDKAP